MKVVPIENQKIKPCSNLYSMKYQLINLKQKQKKIEKSK